MSLSASQLATSQLADQMGYSSVGDMMNDYSQAQVDSMLGGQQSSQGALTQAISAPVVTQSSSALTARPTLSSAADNNRPVTVPDWFSSTPEYQALGTTTTVPGEYTGLNGDVATYAPDTTTYTQPTAAQTAAGYQDYLKANPGVAAIANTPGLQWIPQMAGSTAADGQVLPSAFQVAAPNGATQYYTNKGADAGIQAAPQAEGGFWGSVDNFWNKVPLADIAMAGGLAVSGGALAGAFLGGAGGAAVSGMDLAADAGAGANSIGAAGSALGGGTTAATGGTGALSSLQSAYTTAKPFIQGAQIANSLANGNPIGALSGAVGLAGYGDVASGINAANSAAHGDYLNAFISGANASGQVPSDIGGVKTSDMNTVYNDARAINSGNPLSIIGAGLGTASKYGGALTQAINSSDPSSSVSDTQATADALSLTDGPNQNPAAYALPDNISSPDYLAQFDPTTIANNAAADSALNAPGALTQAIADPNSNPTDGRLANGTQTSPDMGGGVPNLSTVFVTGTQDNSNPTDGRLADGTQTTPGEAPLSGTLYGQVPAEAGLPPVETPSGAIPNAPVIPNVPVTPKSTVTPTQTIAPLPQQQANHLPAVDLSFLNPGATIDENKLMPMAQALVDQSNGTLTLPQALGMVKQNTPKGTK
jgi:hypothetical protein